MGVDADPRGHDAERPGRKAHRLGILLGGLRDNRRGEWWLIAQMALIVAHLLPATPSPASLGLAWPLPARFGGWPCSPSGWCWPAREP